MKPAKLLSAALLGLLACGDPSVQPFDAGRRDSGVPDSGFVDLDGATNCAAPRIECGSRCVDPASDPDNCGECFRTCENNLFCSQSECTATCSPPLTGCGNSCIDLATDETHCGICNRACADDRECRGGDCVCPSGQIECNGACVDEKNDPNNCGICDRICRSDQSCIQGSCECDMDFLECNSACVDDKNDRNNCGICERMCESDEFCNNGTCACAGGDRELDCSDGQDNDCDTLFDCNDPDCVGQSRSCQGSGSGACSTGIETCQANGAWGVCVVGNNEAEICGDGIDQDCNGSDLRMPDSYEPNDSCAQCYEIPGVDPNLTLSPSPSFDSVDDNVDCFKFTANDATSPFRESILISLTGIPVDNDYDVYLYRNFADCESRTSLAFSTNVGNAEENIAWSEDFGGDDSGVYYVRVRRFDGQSCTAGYTLTINGLNN